MNFLQSSEILIPALIQLPITIYTGERNVLQEFEKQFCFMSEIQELFTAKALCSFFEKRDTEFIYQIHEPLGAHLVVIYSEGAWVILGPYVHTPWNERVARKQLEAFHIAKEEVSFYQNYRKNLLVITDREVLKTAFLLLEHTCGNGFSREIRRIDALSEPRTSRLDSTPLEAHVESKFVIQNYDWESRFTKAIAFGETKKALDVLHESTFYTEGIRFMSEKMSDQLVKGAIMRTLVRKSAEQVGVTPILIDEISQDYAVRMRGTSSIQEINLLIEKMIIHFCGIIREHLKCDYSLYIKKATEYIDVNLAKAMTVSELAHFVGISSDYFAKKFSQETGMPLKQYIAKRRCELAADLLMDSKLGIQEIAVYVGYDDGAYFARVFKERFGTSPQKYRLKYSKNIEN
jgi:AraC-like DNA-binding protein